MSDLEVKNPPSKGLSLLKYVTIPKFNGSFSQSIHIWTKQVDQIMELISIPHCMQGAFVMRYLEVDGGIWRWVKLGGRFLEVG